MRVISRDSQHSPKGRVNVDNKLRLGHSQDITKDEILTERLSMKYKSWFMDGRVFVSGAYQISISVSVSASVSFRDRFFKAENKTAHASGLRTATSYEFAGNIEDQHIYI